jgi:hypothetical protein
MFDLLEATCPYCDNTFQSTEENIMLNIHTLIYCDSSKEGCGLPFVVYVTSKTEYTVESKMIEGFQKEEDRFEE